MLNFEKRNLRSGHLMWPGGVIFGVIGHRFLEMCQIVDLTAVANSAAPSLFHVTLRHTHFPITRISPGVTRQLKRAMRTSLLRSNFERRQVESGREDPCDKVQKSQTIVDIIGHLSHYCSAPPPPCNCSPGKKTRTDTCIHMRTYAYHFLQLHTSYRALGDDCGTW